MKHDQNYGMKALWAYVRSLGTAKPPMEWDAPDAQFNAWWNEDYDDSTNPYRKGSPAYWAWAGWKAKEQRK